MVVPSLTKAFLWSNALLSLASALTLPSPNDLITTKKFELTVTWEKGAPDGVERDLFKVNGQFPGPVLELTEGDSVEINVKNRSPFNTTIHYHAWDISEKSHIDLLCFDSILVNGKGKVDCLASTQQAPLVTRPQQQLLSRINGSTLTDKSCLPPNVLATLANAGDAKPDPSVIPREIFNGCKATNAPLDVIKVVKSKNCEEDKWIMLDLIATFSMIEAQVSLDEIPLTIIAADGNYIEPKTAQSIPLAAGQRYTVIAKLEKPKKYTLRVSATSDPQILFGSSIIDFQVEAQEQSLEPSVAYINERGVNTTSGVVVFSPAQGKSFPPAVIPQVVDATYKVVMKQAGALDRWAFNSTPRPESTGTRVAMLD
ncbi:laccase precursor [Apiospora phragmitis]|uniref:Laccase n=1 Tax=Apiospora phragmitis TaxID=2905665 RepID=A0ABR1TUC6_9PEZI